MAWFKRTKSNIDTSTQKREIPDGMWIKCNECDEIIHRKQLELNYYTCIKCNNHFRIGSSEYIRILFDENTFKEMDKKMVSADPLNFVDTKSYKDRIKEAINKTGLYDAVRTGTGKLDGYDVVAAIMDFEFIGGSMGSVVGEKVARAIDKATKLRNPLIIVSQSGGARMMEGALSLMQLAKTTSKLTKLSEAKVPFISVITNPTTGGTSASWALLGDVNIAEPKALIGFAGPRVIRQTIGKDLPEGFQSSEFLLEHGFIDMICHRKELKATISRLIHLFNS